jgi:transcriptional regulator with GAF, ATPase, and Fis domain
MPPVGEPVGRAWLGDHGLADSEVSTQHACFVRAGSQFALIDEGSRNGTFLDGERLGPRDTVTLHDGALIRMGRTLLVYREAITKTEPAPPLGNLIGPWGLGPLRKWLGSLHASGARNVLIQGETGTGKELVARAAALALRRQARYGAVNMAAIGDGVFEAQLFGWRKGAFSGASEGGVGIFASHHGGAVFLDEIGDLPLGLQPKLLRLLDNREVQPVGAAQPQPVDVVIIAATHRDLDAMVVSGHFRADLLARFDRRIELPPLRDRIEDVYPVLEKLAQGRRFKLDPTRVEIEAIERLLLQDWHTNVRGLDRVLAELDPASDLTLVAVDRVLGRAPISRATANLTRETVERALEAAGGNQAAAARSLGVARGKLLRALKRSTS